MFDMCILYLFHLIFLWGFSFPFLSYFAIRVIIKIRVIRKIGRYFCTAFGCEVGPKHNPTYDMLFIL